MQLASILQETIVLNGLTLNLTDTAGLRHTDDIVEKAGIERARQAITQADWLLMVYDAHREHEPLRLATELFGSLPNANSILMIANKIDLSDNHQNLPQQFSELHSANTKVKLANVLIKSSYQSECLKLLRIYKFFLVLIC